MYDPTCECGDLKSEHLAEGYGNCTMCFCELPHYSTDIVTIAERVTNDFTIVTMAEHLRLTFEKCLRQMKSAAVMRDEYRRWLSRKFQLARFSVSPARRTFAVKRYMPFRYCDDLIGVLNFQKR